MSLVSWRRVSYLSAAFAIAAAVCISVLPHNSLAETAACELCIIEVQSTGLNSATEDYVVIANNTALPINLSGTIIKYITAGGTANSKTITLSGILPAHMLSAFVGSGLQAANPTLTAFPTGLAFADDGGTLQLVKSGTILDEVNWGTITKAGFTGTVAPRHSPGSSITRQQLSDGSFVDTGNNAADFVINNHACNGLALNEIQPFAIDESGKDLTPGLEILKSTSASVDQDCPMQINGQLYRLAAGDLGVGSGLSVIQNVIDLQNQAVVIPLVSDGANDLQFISSSYYGAVNEPLSTSGSKLTQPVLLAGQSYSKFSSGWKATYSPTIGSANKLTTTPLVAQAPANQPIADDCGSVVINELLPNPVGDDAGNEWIELRSLVDKPVSLAACAVSVNGSLYQFGADVFVNPGELPVFNEFSNGETTKALSLKNSDTNTVSFGRLNLSGNFEAIQTFQYKDAPEGQTWARFDDGWRWINPTPGLDNATVAASSNSSQPTEFAASAQVLGQQTETSVNGAQANLQIIELLPNPASPETDEEDEFVELYNAGDQAVDLSGYKIEAGSTYAYSYVIPSGSIEPHEYRVFSSGNSPLTLANSAGQAHLVDPNGQIISTTDPYKDAPEGQAWALIDGAWVWTATPTPATTNIYVAPPLVTAAAKTTKKATAKTKAKAKTPAVKKTSAKAAKKSSGQASGGEEEQAPLHMTILVGVGVSALLYAAYEYRQDVANTLSKLRRNRGSRQPARQAA
ncbi:MAG TPA: lamin tail domain-containing protein [Candidatus Saccharimonadales bacterium]|nr:lamin tail domain-containing protein [Candidatus Saccharimonadales bacterium]